MQVPDPFSSPWADKILLIFGGGGLLAGLVSFLNWLSNKNKPRSEIAKNDAQTAQLRADATVKLSGQLVVLHDKIAMAENERADLLEVRRLLDAFLVHEVRRRLDHGHEASLALEVRKEVG